VSPVAAKNGERMGAMRKPFHCSRTSFVVIAGLTLLLGLGMAIVAPNMWEAMNRRRQQQTLADMRSIATAWEARATDRNSYTIDPDPHDSRGVDASDFSILHRVSAADLERALVPTYIRKLPRNDAWGNAFEFRTGDYRNGAAQMYALRSLGSDGRPDLHPYGSRASTDFKSDLVYTNGSFLQYPEEGA
jgi:type II secretory pathway pseudopilin PulG